MKKTVQFDGYEAQLYMDATTTKRAVYYFIVTRKGDSEILAMGQEDSAADAQREAMDRMKKFAA